VRRPDRGPGRLAGPVGLLGFPPARNGRGSLAPTSPLHPAGRSSPSGEVGFAGGLELEAELVRAGRPRFGGDPRATPPEPSTGMTPYLPASTYQVPMSAMRLSRLASTTSLFSAKSSSTWWSSQAEASSSGSLSAEIGLPQPDAGLDERRARPGADRPSSVVVHGSAPEHLEVLRVVVARGQVRLPLAGVTAEESVEALEAAGRRPAVVRPRRGLVVVRRQGRCSATGGTCRP
jgi:hypothetical protein